MFHSIKILKVISIVLSVIFVGLSLFMALDFFSSDLNYFRAAKHGCGLFVAVVASGIITLFIVQAIVLSKLQKELEDEKVAVAEEIGALKKRLEELEK